MSDNELFEVALEHCRDLALALDADGVIRFASHSTLELLAYHPRALIGTRWEDLGASGEVNIAPDPATRQGDWSYKRVLCGDGHHREFETLAIPLGGTTLPGGTLLLGSDASGRQALEHSLEYYLRFTHRYRLATWPSFLEALSAALATASHGCPVVVLALDLDRFGLIDAVYGPEGGNIVIAEVTQRLTNLVGETDTISRRGDDDFVIVTRSVTHWDQASEYIAKVTTVFERPVLVGATAVTVEASIGVTLISEEGRGASDVVGDTYIALREAKEQGGNSHAYFDASMRHSANWLLQTDAAMREALNQDLFCLEFQPVIAVPGGRPVATEALLRWRHPTLGVIPPDTFISLAERTGLIVPIGQWVLRQALDYASFWPRATGPHPDQIAVNVSPKQVVAPGFTHMVADAIEGAGVAPQCLVLELTEGVLLDYGSAVTRTLSDLRRMGVQLVIDDFGSGYATMQYLRRFAVDGLKIDGSFIAHLHTSPIQEAMVTAIIDLSHVMGVPVTAEGVETVEQWEVLADLGCDRAQGFLLSRPVPPEEMRRLECRATLAPQPPRVSGSH